MSRKSIWFLLFAIGLLLRANGQIYYDTICWVWVNDPNYYAIEGERFSDKSELNTLFIQNNVCYYEQAYPFAKTLELLKIHEIRCASGTHIDNVISSLTNRFGNVFYNFSKIELPDDYPMDYDPVDWLWSGNPSHNLLWHLKKIKADLAWDITQGDTTVKIAVLDYFIDERHPDLVTEIVPSNYPYPDPPDTIIPLNYPRSMSHGTAVASFASAETTKIGETPNGQLASVGFDTKIIPYRIVFSSTCHDFLQKALHSSTVAGADVIVACAGGAILCEPDPASGEELVMKEILNNGTVIVMPAGNGYNSVNRSYCGDEYQATEHYPFNSSYDERVIVVTSTDSTDHHRFIVGGVDKTHSHFSTIDICAPGYLVMGAEHTLYAGNPTWPYYGDWVGTSFAAPIVAGACSLLKSLNKDFTPGEIQYFIKSTADPVADESDYHGMLGAGRLNVFGAVSMANNCSPGIISSTEYWNRDTTIVCGLEIMQGGCLTISSRVKLSKHSPIIVHTGGKLIIDDGILTSLDEIQWPGIQVWGDSNEDQNPHNGVYHQGYLELKNGATIENAICAVELWHPNDWSSTGGIVHAYNAVFRNNAKSVHAINYIDHYASGNEIDYNSSFNKCSFIIDDDYIGTETFYKHVDLNRIKGIVFRGCDFSVSSNANGVSDYSAGIAAYGAGFYVIPYCEDHFHDPCPENMKRHNTFTNFHDGIYAVSNGDNARTFSVKYADFNHNKRGIYAEDTGYATILNSEFNIGKGNSCCYGVYATNITGFCIEENSFAPSQYALGDTYGIGIFNSGGINDIYLNTFDGLTCGNLAYGVNYNVPGSVRPPAVKPGLTYSCNDNTSNDIDFYILKDNGIGGIATNQGSSATPSGNTFSGSQYHIYNGGDIINYYYNSNGTNETPTSAKLLNVNANPTTNANSCASHYNNGGVVRNAAEKAELAYIYQTSDNVHVRNMAAGDIVRSCLNEDTTNMAELRLWLGNMGELASDRIVVASYIQNGDLTSALALANTLPNKYYLQGDDLSDHNDYMTLLYLYQTLYNSNRTVRDMTTTELETVKIMAENGYGASQQMAKAILVEIGERAVESIICPDMPRLARGINADNGNQNANDSELEIAVAPIPATTWVSIDYKLPCENSTAIMTIVNSLGVKVMHIELAGEQGTRTIDLRDMPAGVYSYIVRCGEYIQNGKVMIVSK